MLKIELKNFAVTLDGHTYSAAVPTSLFSVLAENGVITNPYYRDEEEKRFSPLMSECEISLSFTLSAEASKLKFSYLKIPELDSSAELVFNGKSVFRLNSSRGHNLDVSGLTSTGENTVLIRLGAADCPRDITFFEGMEFFAFSRAGISGISAKSMISQEGVKADVSIEMLGDTEDVKAVVTLISPSGKIYYGGVTNGSTVINIPDPLLWWPSGYGVQNLYRLSVNLYYENEAIDSKETGFGLRSVFLDSRLDAAFTVNGTEFFAQGSEYRADGKTPALSLFRGAEALVTAAKKANMNFIRFNGLGRYPSESFLNLCDYHGIALECVISLSRMDDLGSSAFSRELVYNFKRFAEHPCVFSVSFDKASATQEFIKIVTDAKAASLSAVLVREAEEGESLEAIVSIPAKKTLSEVCEDEDMNIFSYVMGHHIPSAESVAEMLSSASKSYKYAHGMDELTYMSGILQAHIGGQKADEARTSRSAVGSVVLGSLVDSKPAVSSSMIDSSGRFKASYYLAKQYFSPIRLILKKTDDFGVSFTLSNESKKSFTGIVECTVKDSINNSVYSSSVTLSAEKYSSSEAVLFDFTDCVSGHEREYYLEFVLHGDSGKVLSGAYLFVAPKHFSFIDPVILSEISGSGREFTITARASAFAKDVMFGFGKTDAEFEENCIDITDTSVRRIAFVTADITSAEKLMSELSVMSVYDIGKDD